MAIGQAGFGAGSTIAAYLFAGYGFQGNIYAIGAVVPLAAVLVWRILPDPLLAGRAGRDTLCR